MSESSTQSPLGKRRGLWLALIGIAMGLFAALTVAPTAQKAWKIAHPQKQKLSLHPSLIADTSTTARAIEARLSSQADLARLRKEFQAQQYASYCGVASSVIVLSGLGFEGITQDNFFSSQAEAIHTRYETFFGGMTVAQLGGLLRAHGADARVIHASDSSLEEFRQLVRQNLSRGQDFVLINYLRKAIHQKTGGHISPIAAYDETSDRFLVLDVAAHKYPPVWVKAPELWKSLNTVDSDSNRTRGYVLVQKAQ
jgi:hypothetical protein